MVAPTPGPAGPSSPKGLVPPEWSAQAADAVVDTIAKVRDKTTRPAQIAARAVVYGLVAAVIGIIAAILAIVLVIRLASDLIPGQLWTVYAVLAALFMLGGLVCLGKANRPRTS